MTSTWRKLKASPELWQRYFIREKVINVIREFFQKRSFHEIETPLVIANPAAESYLDVFETTLLDRNRKSHKAYLSTSPEVPLKKLLVAGVGDCFSITKSFRNTETHSHLHNPEFTILEWYRVGAHYHEIMRDCEDLLQSISEAVHKSKMLTYQGKQIDLSQPWERITVAEAFAKWAKVNFDEFLDIKNASRIATEKGYVVEVHNTWEELYNQIFLNEVEKHLGRRRPTILYEFPGVLGALARKKESDPRFAERFEFYIEGLELGDCYGELTDWKEQQERFDAELAEIKRLGKTPYEYDHDFIEALKVGLPACSGIAIGVDRLVMLFSDVQTIQETLFFPIEEFYPNK